MVLVRRAGRRAAGQAALLVAVSFVLCAGLVLLIVVTAQSRAADSALRAAASRADDVADPPLGIMLLLRRPDGRTQTSAGAGGILPDRGELTVVLDPHGPPARVRDVETPAGEFRVRTQRRRSPSGVVVTQAALSLRPEHAERARLLWAISAAGGLALVAATALGAVTGRRTVRGLVDTLSRQRRFVADASHELRTPLTVLHTRAQLLRRHLNAAPLDPAAHDLLAAEADRLITDSTRLGDVVEDLLAASEPSRPDAPPTDLAAAAADAVAALQPIALSRDVTVSLRPCAPITGRSGQPRLPVAGGSTGLRRSLVALLDNAVRHSPPGGTVTVAVTATEQAGTVTIADTGPGIPPELDGRLFDRFSAGERPGRHAAGGDAAGSGEDSPGAPRRYGLGLALVADTVHRAGGAITVDTGAGGTAFTVTLPRR